MSLTLPSGLRIDDPERRLLAFCRKEYEYYDAIEYSDPHRIEPLDVQVTISMNSRIDDPGHGGNSADRIREIHRGLAQNCELLLRRIPVDADLLRFDPDLRVFQELLHAAVQVKGVLVAVATKVLHRKRRNFIPMLDSVVLDAYVRLIGRPDLEARKGDKPHAALAAAEVARAFREDLRASSSAVEAHRSRLLEEGYALTPVRILEILIWTQTERRGYYR